MQQRARNAREDLCGPPQPTLAKIAAGQAQARARDETGPCSLSGQAHRHKVEKHFDLTVTDDDLQGSRNREKIKAEARLDGIWTAQADTHAALAAYKSLSQVERAFRSMKMTGESSPGDIRHRTHVLGHVFPACWPGTWKAHHAPESRTLAVRG